MNPAENIQCSATPSRQREPLHTWYLVVDGNSHRSDLVRNRIGFCAAGTVSEALLPQIRTTACLIAAERWDTSAASPDVFTEEADWFAARILVLGVRVFHLDVSLFPMLKLANERARQFARRRNLPFTPARAQMSLHAGRPDNMLIIQMAHTLPQKDAGFAGNTQALKQQLAAR